MSSSTSQPTISINGAGPSSNKPLGTSIEAIGPLPVGASDSMAVVESVGSALEALQANKMRSFLTMLGIIIGVGAVIVMTALGQGARASVEQRLARLGTNLITISPGSTNAGGVRGGTGSLPSLDEADVTAIERQVPNIKAISPGIQANNVQVVAGNQNWSTQVQANYPSIFEIQDWQVSSGLPYDDGDEQTGALVCDIGQTVARDLFGTANPVGEKILIRNVPFTVKGVLASKGSNGFRDQDDIILMPYSTAQIRIFHQPFVNSIFVQATQSNQIDSVQQEITDLLRQLHHIRQGQADDFRMFNNNQVIDTAEETSNTLTLLLAGVAAVSLIVGGIGIMNIMLVSVTERTREIGIRMAIGARTTNILSQFLIEAILLSVAGGIAGILLGIGSSMLMSRLAGWSTVVTPDAVAIAFGFAAVVGVFFGYYPARKASQLDPIVALRYE